MIRTNSPWILIIVLLTLCSWGITFETYAASGPTKVIIAYAANNPRVAPLWITEEQGFFAKYGIKAELLFIRNSALAIGALISKNIDISQAAGISALNVAGAEKGVDLKIVAAFNGRLTHDLVARPGIKSPNELRGKRLGVQVVGGSLWITAMLALESLGLEPSRDDIRILTIGDQTILSQALQTGVIDVAPLDGAFSQRLKKQGFPILAELYRANIPTVSSTVLVLNSYLQTHPVVVENLVKALIEGSAFTLSPENKPVVIRTIMRRLKISDPSDAEEGYQGVLKATELKPYPSIEGMRNMQRFMKIQNPIIANVNVEHLIDDRLIKRLDESGFIDQMKKVYRIR
ncbi:MAG: ABC transporter substrate-binding protein [Candidatus Binatia bacterium]